MTLPHWKTWTLSRTVSAFGINWTGQLPLAESWAAADDSIRTATTVRIAPPTALLAPPSVGSACEMWTGTPEGATFRAEEREDNTLLMTHEGIGNFQLTADRQTLNCYPTKHSEETTFARTLLDSVMFTCALAQGRTLLHAGAVVVDGIVLAYCGDSGAGKSSLGAALLRSGASFLTDDILAVTAPGDAIPLAHAGPPTSTRPLSAFDIAQPPLADLDGERWIEERPLVASAPLGGIVVLDETADHDDARPATFTELLGYVLRNRGHRAIFDFEAAANTYERVPVAKIHAHSAPASELATMALEWLRSA